jgi:NADPH-dependent 2,4-dienoyl-CoA reductase/sulfur reductase-like enzyme/ferredoxin
MTTAGSAQRQQLPLFPNYTQTRRRISIGRWRAIRLIVFLLGIVEIVALFVAPQLGLDLFFGIAVPALPLLWLVAPGIWRNLCPLAAANQTPRLFGFTRGLKAPRWVAEYGFVIAATAFFVLVPARKFLFDSSGPALGTLLAALLVLAFVGGVTLRGKSGWCSTLCPLLPVQRLYGQHAFIQSPNSHCDPCVGCTKNCNDFNPHVAFLADQYDTDRAWQLRRRLFAAAFPGLIVGFYMVPNPPTVSVPTMYGLIGLIVLVSVGLFYVVDAMLRQPLGWLTALWAVLALNLYYWWTSELTLARWNVESVAITWAWRGVVLALSVAWLVRVVRKEKAYIATWIELAGPAVALGAVAAHKRKGGSAGPTANGPEVTVVDAGGNETSLLANAGAPLLDIIEGAGLQIEAGCRMGVCGADPIAVLEGMESLPPVSSDEQQTLHRLGLAPSTRMACVSRVAGPCRVSLVPGNDGGAAASPPPFQIAADVRRVVVIGHGIAGVTAADFVRRFHPDCEIDLVGREPHQLYNRMAITRLLDGRSAMQGLYLQKEKWYEDKRITNWLNTEALRVDRQAQQVHLATGDVLDYDRLILTTGSRSFVPPIPGVDGSRTFVMRDADDAVAIRRAAQRWQCRSVVVAGGGTLGLETAYALSKLNVSVMVLERSPHLLKRQLDARAAALLQSYLGNLGIDVVCNAEVEQVLRSPDRCMQLQTSDGQRLACDLLVMAAGITPYTELARDAGLAVNRGIAVDAGMRTSDPRVYAAGDCASIDGAVAGLWPPAVKQAEVAARNCLGDSQIYVPGPSVTKLKVVGVDLTSLGRFQQIAGERVIIQEEPDEQRYRKLVVDATGRVVGAILMGYAKDIPLVTEAVERNADVGAVYHHLSAGDWNALAEVG